MRIVIEVDGQTVTAINEGDASAHGIGDVPPGPAPAELLARARKLGAKSAGAAQFGRGAAMAASMPSEPPKKKAVKRSKAAKKRGTRRSR